jgi:ABC-type multidrug transport system fused ATPase/permease subunit
MGSQLNSSEPFFVESVWKNKIYISNLMRNTKENIKSNENSMEEIDNKTPKKISREGVSKARKLLTYLYPYRWPFTLSLILLGVSSSVFLVFPWASGELIAIANNRSSFGLSFNGIGLILIVLLIFQALTSYFRALLLTYVAEKSIADIRKDLYSKLITQPIHFFEQRRVGELSSRATADVQLLQDAISITLSELIRQLIILIGGLIFIFWIAPGLTLIMLGTFPVVIIIAIVFGRYIRKLSRNRQDELATTNVILDETLMAISVVKSFTNEWYEHIRYGKSIDKVVEVSMKFAKVRGIFFAFIIAVLFGAIFFILWLGATMIDDSSQASSFHTEDFIQFITFTAFLGGSLASLSSFYEQLVRAIGASERVLEILENDSEIDISKNPVSVKIDGDISFENVSFYYPSRPELKILDAISFKVEKGKKVALVGSSGAGKSTVMQLLFQYYDIQDGTISVDDKNILDYDLSALRKNMAIVPQDVIMFGGTIRENIAYGDHNANENEIIEAAKKANAWNFISEFPQGLETIVGERGVKLSGGQRQRIAIARAILKNPSILLLDEATSALDAESERLVQEALNNLMEGRTSLIIAHRLATIREVDKILVLDSGKIVESGSHEDLIKIENGLYNQLAKLQFDQPK